MIKAIREDGVYEIYAPYNKDFIAEIKRIGGARWDGTKRCWTVPESAIEDARAILLRVYGETDQVAGEKVTLKVVFVKEVSREKEGVVLFGKTLAVAFGRDSGAKVGDDVTLVSGSITSGGSRQNWKTVVEAGSRFTLRDVNRTVFEQEKDCMPDGVSVEEMEEKSEKEKLIEEREFLLARLAEIENRLKK